MSEKKYQLRELKGSDLGIVCRIISAIGIKEFRYCFESTAVKKAVADFKNIEKKNKEDTTLETVGGTVFFDIAAVIISNYEKAEKDIQTFLASVTGMKPSEIAEMPFGEYGELIADVVSKEEFRDFFVHVLGFVK